MFRVSVHSDDFQRRIPQKVPTTPTFRLPAWAGRLPNVATRLTSVSVASTATVLPTADDRENQVRRKKSKASPPPRDIPPGGALPRLHPPHATARGTRARSPARDGRAGSSKRAHLNQPTTRSALNLDPPTSTSHAVCRRPLCRSRREMKLKERLTIGAAATAVLLTLLLVVDLQMDLGMLATPPGALRPHRSRLVPSHGRVRLGTGLPPVEGAASWEAAGGGFRKRVLQRSNNGSREVVPASGREPALEGETASTPQKSEASSPPPHDSFEDLQELTRASNDENNRPLIESPVIVRDDEFTQVRERRGKRRRRDNPTLGELLQVPISS
ncbi:hypothetical protein J437_LFUL004572 [Ladona fulva]|uniref:Uncharacterized protein n=1 Tax=Ladona fulva TaxID=123851 RepID=A0A8K0JUA3_LADFU|nr:hypothetical protein J437_LFUL004572 [Ladona fulva]